VFPTEKEGFSEPHPKTKISNLNQCKQLIRDASPEFRLILELLCELIDANNKDIGKVIPSIDWPRIGYWCKLFGELSEDETPKWLSIVVNKFDECLA